MGSKEQNKKLLPILLSVVIILGAVGARIYLSRSEKAGEKYLFIEKRVKIEAQVIKGEWGMSIDSPRYGYNTSKGILQSYEKFEINRSLLAIYGESVSLTIEGGKGGGLSSRLTPIYSLPYVTSDGAFKLEKIEGDGKAHLTYMNEEIVLKPGEKWKITKSYVKNFGFAEVNFKEEITIENFGFWKKNGIALIPLL